MYAVVNINTLLSLLRKIKIRVMRVSFIIKALRYVALNKHCI